MILHGIAAMGKNRQIGLKGKLPWKNPAELEHFKQETIGGILIMGRKTFESIKKPLSYRKIIVVTSGKIEHNNSVFSVKSPKEAVELAHFTRESIGQKIWVCGGESIYKELMPEIGKWIVSEVDYDGKADTYLPEFEDKFWLEEMKANRVGNYKVYRYTRFAR